MAATDGGCVEFLDIANCRRQLGPVESREPRDSVLRDASVQTLLTLTDVTMLIFDVLGAKRVVGTKVGVAARHLLWRRDYLDGLSLNQGIRSGQHHQLIGGEA